VQEGRRAVRFGDTAPPVRGLDDEEDETMAWIWDSPPFVDEDDWRYVAEQALTELDERRKAIYDPEEP
jgi:hypothetical protein